jgi:hypothetical protein
MDNGCHESSQGWAVAESDRWGAGYRKSMWIFMTYIKTLNYHRHWRRSLSTSSCPTFFFEGIWFCVCPHPLTDLILIDRTKTLIADQVDHQFPFLGNKIALANIVVVDASEVRRSRILSDDREADWCLQKVPGRVWWKAKKGGCSSLL